METNAIKTASNIIFVPIDANREIITPNDLKISTENEPDINIEQIASEINDITSIQSPKIEVKPKDVESEIIIRPKPPKEVKKEEKKEEKIEFQSLDDLITLHDEDFMFEPDDENLQPEDFDSTTSSLEAAHEESLIIEKTHPFTIGEEKPARAADQIKEARKQNVLTIEIPEELLKKLPDTFNFNGLGNVDLLEAENIAKEDILSIANSLDNNDLFDELEELSLMSEADEAVIEKKIEIKEENKKKAENIVQKADKKTEEKEEERIEQNPQPVKETKSENVVIENKTDINRTTQPETTVLQPETVNSIEDKAQTGKHEIIREKKTPNDESPENIKNTDQIIMESSTREENINEKNFQSSDIQKETESLPPELVNVAESFSNIILIDKHSQNQGSDNISSKGDIMDTPIKNIDVVEGEAKILEESDAEDNNNIIGIMADNKPTFEDLLVRPDDNVTYIDNDLDFIDNSYIKQQYPQLNNETEIEQKTKDRGRAAGSQDSILGLSLEELEGIEYTLFNKQLKDISLRSQAKKEVSSDKKTFRYILPNKESFLKSVKDSIQADIDSLNSLIIEEDVEKISDKLEVLMKKELEQTIQDITDRITIFENGDIQETMNNLPENQKEDLKKLLHYLDELLGKLPEKTIKSFADSEYFDLYKKVLHEMDK